jgi:hypothetical protein
MYTANLDKMRALDYSSQIFFKEFFNYWLNNVLLTWRWWLVVILTIVPWILWVMFRNKDSTYRLLLAGLAVALITSYLDKFGYWLSLWSYPIMPIPIMPPHFPWNLTLAPVSIMATIQFKPNINPYLKSVVYSLFNSFIIQPLSVLLGLYDQKLWKHYYSVPFFIIIYLIAHYLATRKEFNPLK